MTAAGTRPPAPPGMRLGLDPGVRRLGPGGKVLLGGSPLRILRLSETGAAIVDGWSAGGAVGKATGERRLARRLLDAGMAHPVIDPLPAGDAASAAVTVVIPVRDDPDGLARTLGALGGDVAAVVVVDDGSADPALVVTAAALRRIDVESTVSPHVDTTVVRRHLPGGPAMARTAGLAQVRTPLVAFVDAGVVPPPGWLPRLQVHFHDPAVVAVAPRVASQPGPGRRDRYEQARSPLDLGTAAARVAPRSRVAYVPSAFLLARVDAVRAAGGFDVGLRYGEDVDLIFRLVAAGGDVRYEPSVTVHHRPRRSWWGWARQRFGYGTAAAPLDARHPGSVPPLQVSVWSVAAWLLVAAGRPRTALALAAGSAALLPRKLRGVPRPWVEGLRLAGWGHVAAGRWIARAALRPWWPAAIAVAVVSRRARRALLAATVAGALLDWRDDRPPLSAADYVPLRVADDVCYGAGVWWGCVRTRRWGALKPDLTNWPGRRRLLEDADR